MQEIISNTIERICADVPGDRVLINEPMSRHTSFRIGGPAAAFVTVSNEEELAAVLSAVTATGAEHMIIGNGSNLLVSDEGYPGIMIKLGGDFESIVRDEKDPCRVKVGAAMLMSRTSAFLTENGLSGFEFASGIPGSIGGAVFMNAGAYGGEIRDVAVSARHMDYSGISGSFLGEELSFGYRKSAYSGKKLIVTEAKFLLEKGDHGEISRRMEDILERRRSKQPLEFPSAGSVFKRPTGYYAGALIEAAGLKGASVGAAQVSEKHAGFIINRGGASCADVCALIEKIQKAVFEKDGVFLEPEIRRMP